jgi:hypothetical protein
MISKIVILTYQPVTKKNRIDFFIDKFIEKGFLIEFWVLTNIFHPELINKTDFKEEDTYQLNSWTELENQLRNENVISTVFFPHITYEWKVVRLFRILTKYKCKTFFIARGMLAFPNVEKPLLFRIILKLNIFFNIHTVRLYLNNLRAFLLKKMNYVKNYDIVFSAGKLGYMTLGIGHAIEYKRSKIVRINSSDYDQYQKILKDDGNHVNETSYCVFLDEYLPYHPDFKIMGLNTVLPEPYYKSLNQFFSRVESLYNVKVIVAGHPKAQYSINPFDGRDICFFETAKLVRGASLVLAHMSTSVSFAVLFNKPVLFFFNNEIQRAFGKARVDIIKHIAYVLSSQAVNVDNLNDCKLKQVKNLSRVNSEKYDDYKYQYLTSVETAESDTADIIINELRLL